MSSLTKIVRKLFFSHLFVLMAFSCAEKQPLGELTNAPPSGSDPAANLTEAQLIVRADSLFRLGLAFDKSGLKDSALSYYQQELLVREAVPGETSTLIGSYLRVANSYYADYNFQSADRFYDRALLLANSVYRDSAAIIPIYLSAARSKIEIKDFPTANSLLDLSFNMLSRPRFKNDSLLAQCFDRFSAMNYVNQQYEPAVGFLLKEIELIKNKSPRELGRLYSNTSLIYIAQHRYDEALRFINTSIRHDLKWFSSDSEKMAIRYRNKGDIFKYLGRFDSARFYYAKNLAIRKQVYGNKHANTFGAYNNVGSLFLEQRKYDSAATFFQQSLIALVKDFHLPDWKYNPTPAATDITTDLVVGLVAKAEALHRLAESDSSSNTLSIALNTYLLADSVFNIYRKNILSEDNQFAQLRQNPIPHGELVDIAFRLHDMTNDPVFLAKAFSVMEKSRAIVLQEVLQRAEAYNKTLIPLEFKQREKAIMSTRSAILMKLNEGKVLTKSVADSLNLALLHNHDLQRSFEEQLAVQNKNYYAIKYTNNTDLESLKEWLRKKQSTFISFQTSEDNIFAIIVTPTAIRKQIIPVSNEFRRSFDLIVRELHENSTERYGKVHFQKFCKSAHFLYDQLLSKCLENDKSTQNLIISPDRTLATFPFEVLITDEAIPNIVNYNLPYLIKKYSLSYVHSASLLRLQSSFPSNGDRLLAFGFGTEIDQHNELEALPGTIKELNEISLLMQNRKNRFYAGAEASESRFKSEATGFNIVHLAMHGIGDTLNTLQSRLIFNSSVDSLEDGNLYAHELFDLKMDNLDLVVLSACESGIGKEQPGEGIMSIARGFAYAGCPSIIMSLWKIDDRTSATLISDFYRQAQEGQSVDKALATAKRNYLSSASELSAHPSFWAAFIQIGDPRTIHATTLNWWVIVAVLGLCLAGLTLSFGKIRMLPKKKPNR